MDKEKAKAAFKEWNEGLTEKFMIRDAYLAGAEWAWGERNKELEELVDLGTDQVVTERIVKLQAENKKLRECVEFYAHKAFCPIFTQGETDGGYLVGKVVIRDREWSGKNQIGGKRARQCLEEIKQGN